MFYLPLCGPICHLVQKKNKWEISHSRWEISREGWEEKIDLETVVVERERLSIVQYYPYVMALTACSNSILGVWGIFLLKKLFKSSKFSEGIFFKWTLFSNFVRVLEYI